MGKQSQFTLLSLLLYPSLSTPSCRLSQLLQPPPLILRHTLSLPPQRACAELVPSKTETKSTISTASRSCSLLQNSRCKTIQSPGSHPQKFTRALFQHLLCSPMAQTLLPVCDSISQSLLSCIPHGSKHQCDFPKTCKVPMCDYNPFSGLPYIQMTLPGHFALKHQQYCQRLHNFIARHHMVPARL